MKKIGSETGKRTRRRWSLSKEGTARLCDRSLAELEAQGACLLGEADQAQTRSIVARDYSFLAPFYFDEYSGYMASVVLVNLQSKVYT
jgi:hypothetical protein